MPSRAKLAGSGVAAGVLMLSIASRAPPPPVNTSILKVPNTEAKPSSTACPGGILGLKVDVETGFPFSSAATVNVLSPPNVAKLNDTLLKSEEKLILKGPV